MANETNRGIKRSWSLLGFVQQYGQPRFVDDFKAADGSTFCALSFSADKFDGSQVRSFVDKSTGEVRKSSYVNVTFSQNCPAVTMAAISAQKNSLQVVELETNSEYSEPSFKLCAQGEFTPRGIQMNL